MNKLFFFGGAGALALLAPALQAQEVGRVISSVPVIQQVAVPRQVCNSYPVAVEQPRSGAGALLGALAGGAAGNAIGGGSGRAAATALGVLGGAVLGDRVEGPTAQVQQQTHCTTQTWYENRATAYHVTYEYAGKQYSVQMGYDPGPTIPLQVVPVGMGSAPPVAGRAPPPAAAAAPPAGTSPAPAMAAPPASAVIIREVVTVPGPVTYAPAWGAYPPGWGAYPQAWGAYPAPVYRAYAPRISLNLGFVRGGHGYHRHPYGWH